MNQPFVRIRPRKGMIRIDWHEIWQYRELFYFLVWRDIAVRYKQTVMGAAWAVIQPLAGMIVFTIVFGRLAKMPTDGAPYPLFSYSALILWTYFSQSMNHSAGSLVADQRLVTKVYFPRLLIPLSPPLGALVDFSIAFVLLCMMMPFFNYFPSVNIWAVPVMAGLAMAAAAGFGVWMSALNVKYRDFRYLIPFMTQFLMFVSPVVYPAGIVPEKWRLLYALNPLAGAISGFRWAMLGTDINPWPLVGVSALSAAVILFTGLMYFRKTERFFADFI